jgi:hypothetical protein
MTHKLYVGGEPGVRVDWDRWSDPVIIDNMEFEVRLVDKKLQLTHMTKIDSLEWLEHQRAVAAASSHVLECETQLQAIEQRKLLLEYEISSLCLTDNEIRGLCIQLPDLYLELVRIKRMLIKARLDVDELGLEPPKVKHIEKRTWYVPEGEHVFLSLPTGNLCPVLFMKAEERPRTVCPVITIVN